MYWHDEIELDDKEQGPRTTTIGREILAGHCLKKDLGFLVNPKIKKVFSGKTSGLIPFSISAE
jgi:hypothetical protein